MGRKERRKAFPLEGLTWIIIFLDEHSLKQMPIVFPFLPFSPFTLRMNVSFRMSISLKNVLENYLMLNPI